MSEDDYVLGTEAGEIARLGLQHRVWRGRMLDAFRRAGIWPGQTVLDIGAGPGYAAMDLAQAVGPQGRVIALERAGNFLRHLRQEAAAAGLAQIEARAHDVSAAPFGDGIAD
ncbi:MAG: methyltransferase domain-containing protein, partial [Allosphingosinicella sp.]